MSFIQDIITKNPITKFFLFKAVKTKKTAYTLYKEKKLIHYWKIDKIIEYQEKKFQKLLKEAIKSNYYKKIIEKLNKPLNKINISDLNKFPLLTKDIIRSKNNDILIKKAKGIYKNYSGGSTGEPIVFYQDKNYYGEASASVFISDEMAGWYTQARTVKLWGAPEDTKQIKGIKGKIKLYLLNRKYLDTFDMGEKNILKYHKIMKNFKPEIIISYASSIYLFAKYLKDNKIKPKYPKISIITAAETLHPYMKKTIEEVFQVKTFNRYGSREISAAASECEKHNGLHIHSFDQIIEIIDQKTGKNIEEKPGEIVVTNLNNYAFPFIRYKIGDIGMLTKKQCECGRNTPRLLKILGRTTDNFYLNDGRIVHGEYFTHLFYNRKDVKEFQFIQEKNELFTIKIIPSKYFDRKKFTKFTKELKKFLGKNVKIDLKIVKNIPKTKSGKYLFTISKLDPRTINEKRF